jgi:WD40 repeat protein
MIANSYIRNTD